MNHDAPEFHLKHVASADTDGPLEIYSVRRSPGDPIASRRGFLAAGIALSSLLATLGGNRRGDAAAALPGVGGSDEDSARPISAHTGAVAALAVSDNSQLLATAADDETVKLWRLPDGRPVEILADVSPVAEAMVVRPDEEVLAAEAIGTDIVLRTLSEVGEPHRMATDHRLPVKQIALTPDGSHLATAAGREIKLWRRSETALIQTFHGGFVSSLALTPDGSILATGHLDKTITLWQADDDAPVTTLRGLRLFPSALALTPDRSILASGAFDATITLWSLRDGRALKVLDGHEGPITTLAASPDGRLLISGDRRGVVILWDLTSGRRLGFLFDSEASETDAFIFEFVDERSGQTLTFTLPCGAPIPPGATCTCNCVPGTYQPPTVARQPTLRRTRPRRYRSRGSGGFIPYGSYGGGTVCTCNKVCVCIPVCQAHRLLHDDPVVRVMAEQLLLVMGRREFPYMRWAARHAAPALRARIGQVMDLICLGARPDSNHWPSPEACVARLRDSDEVVAIMAAQTLRLLERGQGARLDGGVRSRVNSLLDLAGRSAWFLRR